MQSSIFMRAIISSGVLLVLLAFVGIVFMGNAVLTSNIEHRSDDQSKVSDETDGPLSGKKDGIEDNRIKETRGHPNSPRSRSGRLYQQTNQPIESYAAAYAATSPIAENHQHPGQQSASSADQSQTESAYSSFGESSPSSSQSMSSPVGQNSALLSGPSVARQFANLNDYTTHSNHYANHHLSSTSNEASYVSQPSAHSLSGYYSAPPGQINSQQYHPNYYQRHYQSSQAQPAHINYGYPMNQAYEYGPISTNYYDRNTHKSAASSPIWSASNLHPDGFGLMSSASQALSHWTHGFSLAEIICGLVALSIGAVILGAPFFLIYLALMGNFSGSGTLSLTNPTSTSAATGSATQANGRRKRLAMLNMVDIDERASKYPELMRATDSIISQLSPYVDMEQVSQNFKRLFDSFEKFSQPKYDKIKSAKHRS